MSEQVGVTSVAMSEGEDGQIKLGLHPINEQYCFSPVELDHFPWLIKQPYEGFRTLFSFPLFLATYIITYTGITYRIPLLQKV